MGGYNDASPFATVLGIRAVLQQHVFHLEATCSPTEGRTGTHQDLGSSVIVEYLIQCQQCRAFENFLLRPPTRGLLEQAGNLHLPAAEYFTIRVLLLTT